jgi:hypothetical protein
MRLLVKSFRPLRATFDDASKHSYYRTDMVEYDMYVRCKTACTSDAPKRGPKPLSLHLQSIRMIGQILFFVNG